MRAPSPRFRRLRLALTSSTALIAAAVVATFLAAAPPAFAAGGAGGASEDNGPGGGGGGNNATGPGGVGGAGTNGGGGGGGGSGSPVGGAGGRGGNDDGDGGGAGGAAGGSSGASGRAGEGGSDGGGGGGGGGGGAGFVGSALPIGGATGGQGGEGGDGSSNIFHDGGGGGGGGAGGFGAVVTGSGDLGTIGITITGGNGGNGGDGGSGAVGTAKGQAGIAGAGGHGLLLMGSSNVEVGAASRIVGGIGGTGGYAIRYDGVGGPAGGIGAYSSAGATITNSGFIGGGSGGRGVNAVSGGQTSTPISAGGIGGIGGVGVALTGDNGGLINNTEGHIIGGSGGLGGNSNDEANDNNLGAPGGAGGAGGAGVSLVNNVNATNNGIITGGPGGPGGASGYTSSTGGFGGVGGTGGAGANLSGTGASLTNNGFINGGLGGKGGQNHEGSAAGVPGYAANGSVGVGVKLSYTGATLINNGTIAGNEGVVFTGDANRLELWRSSVIEGNVIATGTSGNVLALGGAVDWNFDAGQIGGQYLGFEAFEKSGSSTWTLTGTMGEGGAWTVDEGTLIVDGSIAASSGLNVNVGGTVGGTGTLTSTTVSGTLSPGDPASNTVGTINVAGDLTFKTGATYVVDVSATTSDNTEVSGTAYLGGVVALQLDLSTDYANMQPLTIVNASGGLGGGFNAISSNSAFVVGSLTQVENTVLLTLEGQAFGSVAQTRNHHAIASVLDADGIRREIAAAVFGQETETAARFAFDQLSGELHASTKTALIEDTRLVRDAVTDRVRAAFGDIVAPAMPVLSYGPDGATPVPVDDTNRFTAWGSAFGAWSSNDGDGNAVALDHSTGGFLVGGDALVGDAWRVGLFTGYSRTSFDADDVGSSGDSDNIHLGVYAGTQWGALGIRLGAAYAWNDVETSRSVGFPGATDRLDSSYDVGTTQLFGELGYRIDTPVATFEPFAGLAYVNLDGDGFTEDGGAAALTVDGGSSDVTYTTLGLRAATSFLVGTIQTKAHAMAGWRHAFGDVMPTALNAFNGGSAFTVAGVPIAEDAAVLEAGLDFGLNEKASLGIAYSGQVNSGAHDHGFEANLKVKF